MIDRAVEWGRKALELDPANQRLRTISIASSGCEKKHGNRNDQSAHPISCKRAREASVKVAVYTIAKNEAAHVERWAESAADADYRIVADTGSTDDTVERLTRAGVTVQRIAVRPWRFDVARNATIALIPDDVDVCCTMDMDMFLEPGWRPKLEAAWTSETTALFCRMATPIKSYPSKSFHRRWGYRFKRPIHEALFFTGEEITRDCDGIVMHHLRTTAANHEQYLGLMELAHREDPKDAQICFWLGRECMWAKRNERGTEVLESYLSLPSSTWSEERSEAMRCLAQMQTDHRMVWLDKAGWRRRTGERFGWIWPRSSMARRIG